MRSLLVHGGTSISSGNDLFPGNDKDPKSNSGLSYEGKIRIDELPPVDVARLEQPKYRQSLKNQGFTIRPCSAEERQRLDRENASVYQRTSRANILSLECGSAAAAAIPQIRYLMFTSRQSVTLSAKDEPLAVFLPRLLRSQGAKGLIDPGVKGTISISIKNVPFGQALSFLAQRTGLSITTENGVVSIKRS